jgi:hypothetical protein
LVLPSSVATVSWLFYANNSQGGLSVMAVQNVSVSAPAATPIPTATIVPTPIATIPPSLVKATPTPTPTANVQATATLLPAATPTPSAIVEPKREGKLLPLTLEAQNAEYGISPSGLVVSVAGLNASVVFTSNFTNNGDDVTVLLQAHLSGSTQEYDLYSQPVSVKKGDTVSLSTEPLGVIGGLYEVVGEVVDADTQMVLSTQSARIDVRTISGRVLSQDGPVLLGLTLLLFGAGGLITLRMRELEKEF